jgi:hypothetical protein
LHARVIPYLKELGYLVKLVLVHLVVAVLVQTREEDFFLNRVDIPDALIMVELVENLQDTIESLISEVAKTAQDAGYL